jgi:branched-chain amino acid transport system ATP-binding protein
VLEVEGVTTTYDGIVAVRAASLSVKQGQIVSLIGSNGAGKTTLLNTISGLLRPRSGRIVFEGADIARLPPYAVARRGLLQVPEGRQVLGPLSVRENLMLGALAARTRKADAEDIGRIYALFPILRERRDLPAGQLSGGEQQMLALGRALMGRPRLLLLDEPSLGLAPTLVGQVFATLRQLHRDGLTILLVEQNARRALELTDYTYVIEHGEIVREGRSEALREDPAVIAHYLGAGHGRPQAQPLPRA